MPGIIIQGQSASVASRVNPYIVYLRETWSSSWVQRQELIIEEMTDATGHQDIGRLVLLRPYGRVARHFDPPGSDYQTIFAQDLIGYWVKVEIIGDNNTPMLVWQGRIFDEARDLGGREVRDANGSQVLTGTQIFTAYSGLNILRRIGVSTSHFLIDEERKVVEILHPMNRRDERNMLVGNRSEELDPDEDDNPSYLHGDSELWDRAQYLRYVLARHVNRDDTPEWALSGSVIMLQDMTDSIDFGDSATVDQMIRLLIDPKFGMDFKVIPTEDGFTISVFSLLAEPFAWNGKEVMANPNVVNVNGDTDVSLERKHIVRSKDHLYERIRVIGRPIVVCFSLYGEDARWDNPPSATAPQQGEDPFTDQRGSLVPAWSETLEEEYRAGKDGSTDPAEHDRARARERFDTVYQTYKAPADWDFHVRQVLPFLDHKGVLTGLVGETTATAEGQQKVVRSTLNFLPLREGFTYSASVVDNNDEDAIPDFMRPQAWVWDEEFVSSVTGAIGAYIGCEKVGIHVSVMKTDWGVFLQASPNHLLAKDLFVTGEEGNAEDTETEPLYDPHKIICTIAIELDRRLSLIYAPGQVSDNSEVVIEVPDAEFWYLAPRTMTDVGESGLPVLGPEEQFENGSKKGYILRDDTQRLAQVMAGAIARYKGDRARAELWFRGTRPFGNFLGFILGVVQQGGDIQNIKAAITSVEWRFSNGEPFTIVRTGHAGA